RDEPAENRGSAPPPPGTRSAWPPSMNADLLRSSLDLVVERHPLVVTRFYELLFARYPQIRALFGRNPEAAREKVVTLAFVAVLDHLDEAPWFEVTLGALGAKLAAYGVTDEMYGWAGECLLVALAQAAGSSWSGEVEVEWKTALTAVAAAMQRG